MSKIISATGHRPDKLPDKETGYNTPNPTYNYVKLETKRILTEQNPEYCISGMALGYDTIFAEACIELDIPFIAAVPFIGQEKIWPQKSKDIYNAILKKAKEVKIVCEGGYSAKKMQIRNEFMVDNSNVVLACWNGSNGGTGNCVAYAIKKEKEIIIIDPRKARK